MNYSDGRLYKGTYLDEKMHGTGKFIVSLNYYCSGQMAGSIMGNIRMIVRMGMEN